MKRIIGISALAYDPLGNRTLYIAPSAIEKMNTGGRRATRTATLDGGAVVYDAGYAAADRTFAMAVKETLMLHGAWFAYLVQTYNLIRISTDDGVFTAVPSRWYHEKGYAWLEALVMEQLA